MKNNFLYKFSNRFSNKFKEISAQINYKINNSKDIEQNCIASNNFNLPNGLEKFYFRVNSIGDRSVIGQIFNMNDYATKDWPQGQALFRYYTDQSQNKKFFIIDAGANIGAASVYFNNVFSNVKIIAVEPEINNLKILKINTEGRPITIVSGAVGSSSEKKFLNNPGLSDYGFRVAKDGEYEVNVFKIDSLIQNHAPNDSPLLMKIDIEGGEEDLFKGDCAWIKKFPLIIIELHDWMMPGQAVSKNFYEKISKENFDIIQRGENTFCFNNEILHTFYKV